MTSSRHMLVLVAALSGCSAGSSTAGVRGGNYSGGMGGAPGTGGMAGYAGASGVADAGTNFRSDAGRGEMVPPNLMSDVPTFGWGTDAGSCSNCTGGASGGGMGGSTGISGLGGSRASGGTTTVAGSGGITSRGGMSSSVGGSSNVGGAVGMGGAAAAGGVSSPGGGTTGGGGRAGTGGAGPADAGPPSDAPRVSDTTPPSTDASVLRDAGADVSPSSPDAAVADLRPADVLSPDTTTRCVAQIEAVIPVTNSFEDFHLTAGTNAQVVLRASVVSGGPPAGVSWSWQASRDGTPLAPIPGKQDPAAAAFPITSQGNYSFTAFDRNGPCSATVRVPAFAANACPSCDSSVILRAAPPPSAGIPVQSGGIGLGGSPPFSQPNVILDHGVQVLVAPSVGSDLLASYIRISRVGGELTVDGLADPKTLGFAPRLLAMSTNRDLLYYDVLVVPIDGSNGGTVAPQLFQNLTPDNINSTFFNLVGGVTVNGTTRTSTGQAVVDVRVMLTNQDPAATQPSKLIFSSVGRSDAQGTYQLHAQPGNYWVSLSPPDGSGLPDALSPSSVALTGNTTIDFKWAPVSTGTLVLNVLDAAGDPSALTRVRLTSAQAKVVGSLTVGTNSQSANGNIQVEKTTSATGIATFANLPDGASYDALLVPAVLGQYAATTAISVALPQGGGAQTASLLAQGRINGQLVVGSNDVIDWSRVDVIAYDRSTDTPEAPLAGATKSDGTFSLAVSPGRPYVVLVAPDAGSGFARTFVAPGLIQATEFTLTQKVQSAMEWSAKVMDVAQNGAPGTALQVFCGADWPGCFDPTIPLAETTSGDGGAFLLWLPDPATR